MPLKTETTFIIMAVLTVVVLIVSILDSLAW